MERQNVTIDERPPRITIRQGRPTGNVEIVGEPEIRISSGQPDDGSDPSNRDDAAESDAATDTEDN